MVPSIIAGNTPHCLVNAEGNVNFLGTRSLIYHWLRASNTYLWRSLATYDTSVMHGILILGSATYEVMQVSLAAHYLVGC